jgi:hypothetical protein
MDAIQTPPLFVLCSLLQKNIFGDIAGLKAAGRVTTISTVRDESEAEAGGIWGAR